VAHKIAVQVKALISDAVIEYQTKIAPAVIALKDIQASFFAEDERQHQQPSALPGGLF
jgi:hypothetical protein